jgi:dihydropteroate synthase
MMQLMLRDKKLKLDRPIIMGILNVTPDSFSDGGCFSSPEEAAERAIEMAEEGADIIDIGGESSRPGSLKISAEEEINRIIPVIKVLRAKNKGTVVSVDTYKSEVASRAVMEGADMINDISGGTFDPVIMNVAAESGAAYVIMHMNGTPENMQTNPQYSTAGVVSDIKAFFEQRIQAALSAGIKKEGIVLDPGIGFGKTLGQNFEILESLNVFCSLGFPVLIGTSRKSFIGKMLNAEPDERLFGTAATVALSISKGASIVRVHDIKEMKDTAVMAYAMVNFSNKEGFV